MEESDQPIPPRYRWTKRGIWILLFILGLLLGLRLVWGYLAHRALEKEIEAIRARGEPIETGDFDVPGIPDSSNAAWYLRQAWASLTNADVVDGGDFNIDDLWRSRDISQLGPVYDANQQAINFVRQAGTCDGVVWFDSISKSAGVNEFSKLHFLSQVMAASEVVPHVRGNDAEAIRMLHDEIRMADAVEHYWPGLTSHLVAIRERMGTIDTSINLSRDLRISNDSSGANREQVSNVIRQLLDEKQNQTGFISGFKTQRARDGDPTQPYPFPDAVDLNQWLIRPILEMNAAALVREETRVAALIPTDSSRMCWPELHNAAGDPPWHSKTLPALSKQIAVSRLINDPVLAREAYIQCIALLRSRMAASALAIRLYRLDHAEKWPESLSLLVPQYLPSIPVDPFSPNGDSIIYKLKTSNDPIIYSVGENGVDDGGSENERISLQSEVRSDVIGAPEDLDIVIHLLNQAAVMPPQN